MTDRDNAWTLEHAIEIAKIGAGQRGYRCYPGSGGIWAGRNEGIADGNFVDWGLGKATEVILNAVIEGRLVPAPAETAASETEG